MEKNRIAAFMQKPVSELANNTEKALVNQIIRQSGIIVNLKMANHALLKENTMLVGLAAEYLGIKSGVFSLEN